MNDFEKLSSEALLITGILTHIVLCLLYIIVFPIWLSAIAVMVTGVFVGLLSSKNIQE